MNKKALIIGNGIISKHITSYLDGVDYVLALDYNLHTLAHILPLHEVNAILGDFDTVRNMDSIAAQYPHIKIIPAPDQNYTDFEKGLQYLIDQGYETIYGFGLTGNRMDHTFNNIVALAKHTSAVTIQLIDDYSKIECIPNDFSRMYQQNTVISLFPIGIVTGITTENLKYPLHDATLTLMGPTGSSNSVASDGLVSIHYQTGKLIMMECWD